jgi:hypothetical protein
VPSAFNDVKAMSFMSYSVAMNSMAYLGIGGLLGDKAHAQLLITLSALSAALFSSWAIIIAAKFYTVLFRSDLNRVDTGNTQSHKKEFYAFMSKFPIA